MPTDDLELALQEMEKRCEAATEGEWKVNEEQAHIFTGPGYANEGQGPYLQIADLGDAMETELSAVQTSWNLDFIANARQDLPRLIAGFRAMMRVCRQIQTLQFEPENYSEDDPRHCFHLAGKMIRESADKALSLARSKLAGDANAS